MGLVLASKSPRRRELMNLLTPYFMVDEAQLDEKIIQAGTPIEYANAVARAKVTDVAARRTQDVVIGCDTVVDVDGQALGKPADEAEVAAMLRRLAGRWHQVHTGVCITLPGREPLCFVETTRVEFDEIPEKDLLAYAASSEPLDKAGGYGIQGWAARYIPRLEGCYHNVMGLPVSALYRALREVDAL